MTESNTMELSAMKTLIRLVSAGAKGRNVGNFSLDWAAVLPLAAEQSALSLVACALLHSPDLECPAELREHLLGAMRTESSVNLIRRQRIMQLLAEMKEQGIDAKVIKGYAVADCYKYPECRGSADNDLLIDIGQEGAAIRFLEEKEFKVSVRDATSHHSICRHKKYGMLELHVSLYAELVREIWFRGMCEADFMKEALNEVDGDGASFASLGYTDHLIFITLHMIKHFILNGLTVRMMLDIALFFSYHKERIDTNRLWETMDRLGYSQLVNCILWSMILYGGFQSDDFPGCADRAPEQIELIFDDLLAGGYMGAREEEARHQSAMEYNRLLIMKNKTAAEYRLYMLGWKIRNGIIRMFPDGKRLREIYPSLNQRPVLMPAIRVYHMFSFTAGRILAGTLKRDIRSEASEMSKETQRRLEMFRKLRML